MFPVILMIWAWSPTLMRDPSALRADIDIICPFTSHRTSPSSEPEVPTVTWQGFPISSLRDISLPAAEAMKYLKAA